MTAKTRYTYPKTGRIMEGDELFHPENKDGWVKAKKSIGETVEFRKACGWKIRRPVKVKKEKKDFVTSEYQDLVNKAVHLADTCFQCGWRLSADWQDIGRSLDALGKLLLEKKVLSQKPRWVSKENPYEQMP